MACSASFNRCPRVLTKTTSASEEILKTYLAHKGRAPFGAVLAAQLRGTGPVIYATRRALTKKLVLVLVLDSLDLQAALPTVGPSSLRSKD